MVSANPVEIYRCYRFVLESPEGETMGCEQVWSSPFDRDMLWLVKGHLVEKETLDRWMSSCVPVLGDAPPKPREHLGNWFRVRMLGTYPYGGRKGEEANPAETKDRIIRVSFDSWAWLPFDLDAKRGDVARESVRLEGVRYETE